MAYRIAYGLEGENPVSVESHARGRQTDLLHSKIDRQGMRRYSYPFFVKQVPNGMGTMDKTEHWSRKKEEKVPGNHSTRSDKKNVLETLICNLVSKPTHGRGTMRSVSMVVGAWVGRGG